MDGRERRMNGPAEPTNGNARCEPVQAGPPADMFLFGLIRRRSCRDLHQSCGLGSRW